MVICINIINPRTVILAGVPNDPIVEKEGDYASTECIRTQAHRQAERAIANTDK